MRISSNPLRHFKLRPKFWDIETEGVLGKEDYPKQMEQVLPPKQVSISFHLEISLIDIQQMN